MRIFREKYKVVDKTEKEKLKKFERVSKSSLFS